MKEDSQVRTLLNALLFGCTLDRVTAFKEYGVAYLRSSLSDIKRMYGIEPKRRTKPGHRYREYWIENNFTTNHA